MSKNRLIRKLGRWAMGLAVMFAALPANAWGPLEHKAIALIAQHRLDPQALAAVQSIMGGTMGMDKISVCADSMLYTGGMMDCGGAFMIAADPAKTTRRWHYIDMPVRSPASAQSMMRYCPNGRDCVVEQIRRQAAILQDAQASLRQRQVALMFLVHLVGDAHQPMHAADDKDGGGNGKSVMFKGQRKNLHSLWDDMILAEGWQQQAAMDQAPLAAELEADIKQRDWASWIQGDFITAAVMESYEIAKDRIYPQYAEDLGQNLGDAYQAEMQPIAKQRLEMSGVRLAALLNRVLAHNPESSDALQSPSIE